MYTATWFDMNKDNWGRWLDGLKGKEYLRFLEIGCFEGRATVWLLENILTDKTSTILAIDTFEGSMEHKERGDFFVGDVFKNYQENVAPFPEQVLTKQGLSQEVLRGSDFKAGDYDFIYIDGSHRSPDVLEDTILAWRLLKKGGIMIWDDYMWDKYEDTKLNPRMAIDAFLAIFEGKYKLIAKEYQVCVEKIGDTND